jgi:hypothetical protein
MSGPRPGRAYLLLFDGAFGSHAITETLTRAPADLHWVGWAMAFRAHFYNIEVEDKLYPLRPLRSQSAAALLRHRKARSSCSLMSRHGGRRIVSSGGRPLDQVSAWTKSSPRCAELSPCCSCR